MSGDARKPGYHMKWIGHHLKKAMSKFTPTGYGHAHRRNLLAKLVERAYSEAAKHGITAEELTNALAKRMHVRDAGTVGGGGGQGETEVVEVGLVSPPTTNLKVVSSQYQVEETPPHVGDFGVTQYMPKPFPHRPQDSYGKPLPEFGQEATLVGTPVEAAPVVESATPVHLPQTQPEGPQWPQKASVRVLGPCPNPKVWSGKIEAISGPNQVSLESSPTRQWKRGEAVEAELIRGGGSPIYRAVS